MTEHPLICLPWEPSLHIQQDLTGWFHRSDMCPHLKSNLFSPFPQRPPWLVTLSSWWFCSATSPNPSWNEAQNTFAHEPRLELWCSTSHLYTNWLLCRLLWPVGVDHQPFSSGLHRGTLDPAFHTPRRLFQETWEVNLAYMFGKENGQASQRHFQGKFQDAFRLLQFQTRSFGYSE